MMTRLQTFLCSLFFFPILLAAQGASLNVTQVGHLAYNQDLSDVWGYVDTSGTEYALVGVYNGVSIVDLSNPANPTEIHFLPGVSTIWRDLKTWGQHAYVTNEGGDGIRIIDLSGLPGTVNYKDTVYAAMTTSHNLWIDEFGFAYIVGGNDFNGGIAVLDLNSDPWNPSLAGSYVGAYVHDVYVRGNKAYNGEIYSGTLKILDVSNKANMTTLGSVSYPNGFTHNTWLDDTGNYCFTTDELDQAYLQSWDVSDPGNITRLDGIRSSLSNGAAVPHNAHYFNGFLVTSYYADGLNIVDASRPTNLVEVGYYDTNPQTGGGTFGLWGAYPFLPSGLVLGTDMSEGLFVFDVDYVRASYLEGVATDSTTGNPIVNVTITITGPGLTELTSVTGEYAMGIPDSGSYVITATKFGYASRDTTVTLAPGVVVNWNPRLPTAPVAGLNVIVEEAGTGNRIPNAQVSAEALGQTFTYQTDANGEASDANFLAGAYDIIGGKWGYVSDHVLANIDQANNTVTIQLSPGYYDDFTFDFGWVFSGTATDGGWERGEPVGTYLGGFTVNPEEDVPNDLGTKCLVTGNGGGIVTDDDVDGGQTTAMSPVMDLSGYNNPYLVFDWWHISANNFGTVGFRDSLVIEIDNGLERKRVWFRKDLIGAPFSRDSVAISSHIALTNNMRVIVRSSDNLFDHIVESAFDHMVIDDKPWVAVEQPVAADDISVWPNPNEGDFRLRREFTEASALVEVVDLQGRQVWASRMEAGMEEIRIRTDLEAGIYFVRLSGDGPVRVKKLVVR